MCEVNWSKQTKCLYVIRMLRAERYSQCEIDYLFKTLVISTITFGLARPSTVLLQPNSVLYNGFLTGVLGENIYQNL